MKHINTIIAVGICAVALTACGKNGKNGSAGANGAAGPAGADGVASAVSRNDVIKTNANIAFAAFGDAHISAITLKSALSDLVSNPSKLTHTAAKQAWLSAREPYGQTEVYRFRDGPIDALTEDGSLVPDEGPEGRINAWPLGEAVIDYVANQVDGDDQPADAENNTNVSSGNIVAMYAADSDLPVISAAALKNGLVDGLDADERNVITGYHAIEFLLWGQDLNADGSGKGARDATPGTRPWSDYDTTAGNCTSGQATPATNEAVCVRRGEFLLAAADLLIDDLEMVVDAWSPVISGNHYANFIAGGDESLGKILGGMGRLSFGELAGERMNIALQDDSQEDEHSCFSDNTHRDIYLNAKGVQNTFEGKYIRIDGTVVEGASLSDLLASEGEVELQNKLRGALEDTMIKISALDQSAKGGVPFDNQIQIPEYKSRVALVIEALAGAQTETLEEVIETLGITDLGLRQDTEEDI